MYYDKQGKQLDCMAWSALFEDPSYRLVKNDILGKYLISTIWLGLSNFTMFETMIFELVGNHKYPVFDYMERCGTESEALANHEEAVEIVRKAMEEEKPGIPVGGSEKGLQSPEKSPSV
jgi:hypothetical protein